MPMLDEVGVPPEDLLDIAIPAKPPRLVQPAPRIRVVAPDLRGRAGACIERPAYHEFSLAAAWALGVHTSVHGVCYPRLERIAAVGNRGRSWAYVKLRDLERWGYVRRLKTISKRKRRAITRQVMWEPDSPLPPKLTQEEKPDPTLRTTPWMFPSTEEGDAPMA